MDTFTRDLSNDLDLDELMTRVREAALGTGGGSSHAAHAQAPSDTTERGSDLISVIEAQHQWNEHTRKALTELVECLQTLRDDWAEAETRLRAEMDQLSTLVRQVRTPGAAPARRKVSAPAARRRRTTASHRANGVRNATKGGKQRS